MPEFTITRQIGAPVEKVWEVLNDFGDIAKWSPGVKKSELTSDGPVSEGATRHCDFSPLGGVNERIDTYIANQQMTVNLYETFKLPIAGAIADFNIAKDGDGTTLTINYSYEPNRLGRVAKDRPTSRCEKGSAASQKTFNEKPNALPQSDRLSRLSLTTHRFLISDG